MANVKLPPMPPNYHGWWQHQKTERVILDDFKKCSHVNQDGTTAFEINKEGAQCRKCHLGFLGRGFEIRDGKLYNTTAKHIN